MVEPRASTGGVLIIIMIGCITLAVGITLVVLFTCTCIAQARSKHCLIGPAITKLSAGDMGAG